MSKVMKQKITTVNNNKQQGFTLIEIAIVLVIIGLLLGGVLKGQELINTARVRALNNNVDGITAAWFSFQDRYRAFPGDYTQATINLPDPAGVLADGDGDGLVGVNAGVDSPAERASVWTHLQAAGYITGNFDGANVAATAYNCVLASCPDNGFGAGMNLNYGALNQTQAALGAAAVPAHELITGRGIPVEVLAELDRKVDDGNAGSGAMQLGAAGLGWVGAAVTACQSAGNANLYGLQTPSSNCAAVFRNF